MADFPAFAAEWVLEVAGVIIAGQTGLIVWLLQRLRRKPDAPAAELAERLREQEIELCVKNLAKVVGALQKSVDYLNREVAWMRGHFHKAQDQGDNRGQLG